LDPGVTGVLPVALGKSTRIVQALLPAGKEYVCIMHLHDIRPEQDIRDACAAHVGVITQLPPVKSAVKRVERERTIYYLDVLEIDGRDVLFRVGCQAGTYIRRLCEQIGKKLGTNAHMAELVRTKAGPFLDANWVSLQDLEDAQGFASEGNDTFLRYCIQPVEVAIRHLPHVVVFCSCVGALSHGIDLKVPGVYQVDSDIEKDALVAVMTRNGELIALGKSEMSAQDMIDKTKGLAVRVNKVFVN
jgi:H/ACA ribonucleoprotein complex subunit 4